MYCHVGIQSGKTCLAKLFSGWLGPEDPALKERLTSLLDDVPCLSVPSPLQWSWRGRAQALGCGRAGVTQLDGRATSRGLQGVVGCQNKRAFTWGHPVGKNILGETFFHQSKGQRQKNGLESKFGTSSSRNPISDVSIRVVDESPHLLVGQTCTT